MTTAVRKKGRFLPWIGGGVLFVFCAAWLFWTPEQVRPESGKSELALKRISEAVTKNDYVRLGFLLGAQKSMPERNSAGKSLLSLAAENNAAECVEVLLYHGAPTEQVDALSIRPLAAAAAAGNLDVVRLLLNYGADIDGGRQEGRTALILGAENGNLAVVDYLLNAGAAYWPGNAEGRGALNQAVRGGHEDVALRLLAGGAPPDTVDPEGDSTLLLAVRQRMKLLTARLLELKVNREHRNRQGESAHEIAQKLQDAELLKLLDGE